MNNDIFPVSAIDPMFKNGMQIRNFFKDLIVTDIKDLEDQPIIFKRIVLKNINNTLSFNEVLLWRDIIKFHVPDIYCNFDEEARYVSKKLKILCTASQFKKVHLSKHFKNKNKERRLNAHKR